MGSHTDTIEILSRNALDCINICCDVVKTFSEELMAFDSLLEREEKKAFAETSKECLLQLVKCENEIKNITQATVLAVEEGDEQDDENTYEERLNVHLENMAVDDNEYRTNPKFTELMKQLEKRNASGGLCDESLGGDGEDLEEVEEESSLQRIPIDPFTQREVKTPVKNKKCNHIYDKEGILQYLKQKQANKATARCPAIGCANRNVTVADLVEDKALKMQIARLRQRAKV